MDEQVEPERSGERRRWPVLLAGVWLGLVAFVAVRLLLTDADASWWRLGSRHWRVGTIPGLRGRILDERGFPLAWSNRQFALLYRPADNSRQGWAELMEAQQVVNFAFDAAWRRVQLANGAELIIKDNLDGTELVKLAPVLAKCRGLRVVSRFVRHYYTADPEVARALGQTSVFGQKEVGISGWELEYDRHLRGQDGRYEVVVNWHGDWITRTWHQLAPPAPGNDVYLPLTVAPVEVQASAPARLR